MNDNLISVDSNIIVYAYDAAAKEKHLIAKNKLSVLWDQIILPFISVQVLQECYVAFLKRGIPIQSAKEIIRLHLQWNVLNNDSDLLMIAIHFKERWQLFLGDALIIAAARRSEANVIWSEDLNPGQEYEGIKVVNPFHGALKP